MSSRNLIILERLGSINFKFYREFNMEKLVLDIIKNLNPTWILPSTSIKKLQ